MFHVEQKCKVVLRKMFHVERLCAPLLRRAFRRSVELALKMFHVKHFERLGCTFTLNASSEACLPGASRGNPHTNCFMWNNLENVSNCGNLFERVAALDGPPREDHGPHPSNGGRMGHPNLEGTRQKAGHPPSPPPSENSSQRLRHSPWHPSGVPFFNSGQSIHTAARTRLSAWLDTNHPNL
jgi:hypothetical protein